MRDDVLLFVISSSRPGNIAKMRKVVDRRLHLNWIVPHDQQGEYRQYAGDSDQVIGGGNLMDSRNLALSIAADEGSFCLQLSDDLTTLRFTDSKVNKERTPLGLDSAVEIMRTAMESTHARLAGVAPTDNAFFYNHPISTNLFIVGDMILVDPSSTLRFDTALTLKEDYDFTLQHLTTYGVVARCNQILASFQHRTNRGGAVAYRTPLREEENIAYLLHKWGSRIVRNPRREHEVLLKWK